MMATASRKLAGRMLAAVVAVALVLFSFAVFFDTSGANNAVIPQAGATGYDVYGTIGGEAVDYSTAIFNAERDEVGTPMFSTNISRHLEVGVSYEESTWGDAEVPNSSRVARVLELSGAAVAESASKPSAIEIAATQAAIWHFSDGFDLDVEDGRNDPAVIARYEALVAEGDATPANEAPAGTITISPESGNGGAGEPIFFDLTGSKPGPLSIDTTDRSVHIHATDGDVCETDTEITSIADSGSICVTSDQRPNTASLTVRTVDAPLVSGRVFSLANRQKLVAQKLSIVTTSQTFEANWAAPETITTPEPTEITTTTATVDSTTTSEPTTTESSTTVAESTSTQPTTTLGSSENNPPTVSLECPEGLVNGEPALFTAVGSDDDGDELSYRWYVNSIEVQGQSESSIDLTVGPDDRISVIASDGESASEAVLTSCKGEDPNRPPTVTVSCPAYVIFGEPTLLVANGQDPNGDPDILYTWYINGSIIEGENGASVEVSFNPDDVVSVTATNSNGVTSAVATANCSGNSRPTISLTCPTDFAYDEPVEFTAIGTDADGDELTYSWRINDEIVEDATESIATLTIEEGDVVSVTATDDGGLSSAGGTSTCVGNSAPTVTLNCPQELVYGEESIFSAEAEDPDGDSVTFVWTVDGEIVDDATTETVALTIDEGQTVTVTAIDPTGSASDSVEADCGGKQRPQIVVTCPVGLVYGEPATFAAQVSNLVGEGIFTWAVSGKTVPNEFGASATLTIVKNDTVSVNVYDVDGLTSETKSISCNGNTTVDEPTAEIPATPSVLGTKILRVAEANIAQSTLAATGAEIGTKVGFGLVVIVAGAAAISIARRRRRD